MGRCFCYVVSPLRVSCKYAKPLPRKKLSDLSSTTMVRRAESSTDRVYLASPPLSTLYP